MVALFVSLARRVSEDPPRRLRSLVVTMSAGIAGLTQVLTADAIEAINARGDRLRTRLNAVCHERGARLQFTGLGSLMSAHTADRPIRTPVDAAHGDAHLKGLFFFDMLRRGVYMARRGFMALSLPIGDAEIDHLVEASMASSTHGATSPPARRLNPCL